jgi:hypothetical protein
VISQPRRHVPADEARCKIIREWMSLPKDKRQTEEQALTLGGSVT